MADSHEKSRDERCTALLLYHGDNKSETGIRTEAGIELAQVDQRRSGKCKAFALLGRPDILLLGRGSLNLRDVRSGDVICGQCVLEHFGLS